MTRTLSLILTFFSAAISVAQSPSSHPSHVDSKYGDLPLQFEPNQGQSDSRVKFLSRGSHYNVLLEPNVATLVLNQDRASKGSKPQSAEHAAIRMTLTGADPNAAMSGESSLPGYVNYMSGSNAAKWQLGLQTYGSTRVAQAYPGIDLVYYGTGHQLEYDFVVAPNADPRAIHLAIQGAHPVLEQDGGLRLQIASARRASDVLVERPVVYQTINGTRKPVEGAFQVAVNGDVHFALGAYDHTRELVIDPIISYASYFGGTGEDEINASALNAKNQLYAVGQTFSTALPATAGEFQTGSVANNNGHDAFVTKFSADGSTILWTTFLSGVSDDFATGVAVNSSDQAYVVGYTGSCIAGTTGLAAAGTFPYTSDAVQQLCNPNAGNNEEVNEGGYDAFLVKLSSDGKSLLYGTPLGGTNTDIASGVALDASGKIYIVGETLSTGYHYATEFKNDSDTPGYPVNNHGQASIGVSNYPTTSNAFYTNTTESKMYTSTGGDGSVTGATDEQAFLTVLSADGHSIVYSSLIGGGIIGGCGNGDCNTNGIAIAVNANGIAYIGGNTSSAHWPVTPGAFATTCSNAGQARSQCPMTGWVAAFDPTKSGSASLLFTSYINGTSAGTNSGNPLYPGSDVYGIATDSLGNAVLTGDTNANDFPTTKGVFQPACAVPSSDGNGDSNVCVNSFLTKLSPTGSTVWSSLYGGITAFTGGEQVIGQGVALDAKDNVFVVGLTNVPSIPLKNPIVRSPAGIDGYVIELSSDASTLLFGTFLGTGGGINLNTNSLHLDSADNAYFSGSQAPNPYGGTSFPITANAAQKTLLGNSDGWVVKMTTQAAPTTTTLTVSPNPATPTQPVTLTATVASAATGISGTPSGTVSFMNGTAVVGTAVVTSGTAVYSGTLTAGTYNITAVYPGDASYAASVSSATSLVVSSTTNTATTLTVNPTTAVLGQAVTLTSKTVIGTTAVTGGSVAFTAGSVTLGTANVGANGVASVSVTPAVGTYSVIASYTGTATTANPTGTGPSASAGVSVTITKATPNVAVTATPTLAAVGAPVKLTATVASAAGTPTGSLKFYNGATLIGSGNLSAGVASFTSSSLPAGTYSITAVYSGDTSFLTATSSAVSITVRTAATTTTTLTSSSLTASTGAPVTLSAAIASSASGSPSGTVAFFDGTTSLGSSTVTSGAASITTSTLIAGNHTLSAVYSGDSLFLTSTSASIMETIITPTLAVSAAPNPLTIPRGKSGTTTITLTPTRYVGNISFSCSGLPAHATCSFAPATISFTPTSGVTTDILTINTEATTARIAEPHLFEKDSTNLALAGLSLPACLFALLGLGRGRRSTRRFQNLLMLAMLLCGSLAASTALSGCGSSAPAEASPGTYPLSVAVTGSDGTTQSLSISVVIQ